MEALAGHPSQVAQQGRSSGSQAADWPTLFHVTHWKAGSQWVHRILRQCAPGRIVDSEVGEGQFLSRPIVAGHVYPTVYVTRQQYEFVAKPAGSRFFYMLRDLRDTLISAYFSLKISHPVVDPAIDRWRAELHARPLNDGLIYLMDEWLPYCSRIQESWLGVSGPQVIRYEELLRDDVRILRRVLLDVCAMPVAPRQLEEIILAHRFERLSGGRARGQENPAAHERKGIAGDWRNYFDAHVKGAFKDRFGALLVATGYEQTFDW